MVRDKNSEREKKEGMENDEVGDSKYTVTTEYSVLTTMDGSGITLPVPWSSSLGILTVFLSTLLSTLSTLLSLLPNAAQFASTHPGSPCYPTGIILFLIYSDYSDYSD